MKYFLNAELQTLHLFFVCHVVSYFNNGGIIKYQIAWVYCSLLKHILNNRYHWCLYLVYGCISLISTILSAILWLPNIKGEENLDSKNELTNEIPAHEEILETVP